MPARKKTGLSMKCIKGGVISNGQGGFYREGTEFEAADAETAASLKAKGMAE